MYCKTCGKTIDDDSLFCSFCGSKQSSKNRPGQENPASKDENKVIIGAKVERSKSAPSDTAKGKRYDDTYERENDALLVGVFLLFASFYITFTNPIRTNEIGELASLFPLAIITTIIIRILITFWVIRIAKKQNRIVSFWAILAFLFPAVTLIIVGLLKKIMLQIELDDNLNDTENCEQICGKANDYLGDKLYSNSLFLAEKAIELFPFELIAIETYEKVLLEIPLSEIPNKKIQTVLRETIDGGKLKIVCKKYETIGAKVYLGNNPAPDGVYLSKKPSRQIIVKDGVIENCFIIS